MSLTSNPPLTSEAVPEAVDTSVLEDDQLVVATPRRGLPVEVNQRWWDGLHNAAVNVSRTLGMRAAGWAVLAAGIVMVVVGWALSWLELRVAGVAAIALALISIVFTLVRPTLSVMLAVPQYHVQVGSWATGELVVRNAQSRRTLPSRIDLPIGDQVASIGLPSLGDGEEMRQAFVIPTERRAVIEIGPALSVQGDPFGFAGRESHWTEMVEVFIHPRVVSLPGRQTGFVHDLEGHATQKLSPADMNFHALREYVPGDDRRHVHWRSSARTGDLMVRQFEETRQSRIVIAVDLSEQSYAGSDEFEDAVSVAASFVEQSFREENPVALATNTEVFRGLSATRMKDHLSRIERLERTHVAELFGMVRDREATASIVVLVTGSTPRTDRLRRLAMLLGIETRVILIRVDPFHSLRVDTVAGVTAIRLPSLEVLPRAVRRANA